MLPPVPSEVQLQLSTRRMLLEPVTESHAEEVLDLFKDSELHRYVPFEPASIEATRARCARWASRKSPSGDELWLNWLAREQDSRVVIGHFQAGVKEGGVASIGYLVARQFQGQDFACEGLESIFDFLSEQLAVQEIKAWVDTRNIASIRLAEQLGMKQSALIRDADFFKGATSDEFVFSWKRIQK